MTLEVDVLGPVRVRRGSQIIVERPAHRRLLSILSLEAGDRVATETLIDRFWDGRPPDAARGALQTHISTLRKLLGSSAVQTEGYGYRLAVDGNGLDMTRFESLSEAAQAAAQAGDWEEAAATGNKAIALWRGRPFDELRDDEFARSAIARLEETHLEMQELRARAFLELGRPEEVLPGLEALVVDHPYRERLWEHLMTARYRLGRSTEALRAYREVTEHLASIGVEPGERLRRLEERVLLHDRNLTQVPNNLPKELDEFVGRREELERVRELLRSERLVTLTGAGGSGKTRLAVSGARSQLVEYPDGVWFVDLAPISAGTEIPSAITRSIGLKPNAGHLLESLLDWLRPLRVLVILDNCEHLLDAVGQVAEQILRNTDQVAVLATSRGSLGVPGEQVYEVPGLSTSEESADAIELFLIRASKAGGSGRLGPHRESIVDICRRLDGMPLAIEFAAARTRSLAPTVIAERLEDRFRILTASSPTAPLRHQTLEATLDWSYQLLSREEQALLRRLSVFRGGFTIEMAEDVCAVDGLSVEVVVPTLSSLVDKSLVVAYESPSGPRHRLLETVAEYGLRLMPDDEMDVTMSAHLDWAVAFSTGWHRRYLKGREDQSFSVLAVEADNLAAAFDRASQSEQSPEMASLETVLAEHFEDSGQTSRAQIMLERALERGLSQPDAIFWETQLAGLLFNLNRTADAMSRLRLAASAARVGDPTVEGAHALIALSHLLVAVVEEDPVEAVEVAREGLAMAAAAHEPHAVARAHRALAWAQAWNGDTKAGLESAYRGLELSKQIGTEVTLYPRMFDILFLDPDARREGPINIVREMEERFGDWSDMGTASHWFPWIYAQVGRLDLAQQAVDLISDARYEGYYLTWQLITGATVNWMTGHLKEAAAGVRAMKALDPNPRWYHDFYPLVAEVNADRANLAEVRSAAQEYVDVAVHSSEEAMKLGVLSPLVRAEVDAFLTSGDEDHRGRAEEALELMRAILTEHPPPREGSVSMETHSTHIAFAEAELSRATRSDPELWARAQDKADYIYYRLYAGWRLGESLLDAGRNDEGKAVLLEALDLSKSIGTGLLTTRMESTAQTFDLDMT